MDKFNNPLIVLPILLALLVGGLLLAAWLETKPVLPIPTWVLLLAIGLFLAGLAWSRPNDLKEVLRVGIKVVFALLVAWFSLWSDLQLGIPHAYLGWGVFFGGCVGWFIGSIVSVVLFPYHKNK